MKRFIGSALILALAGCSSNEAPPQEPMCFKIFEPSDAHGIEGSLRGDFPSLSNAKLFLGYHNPGSFVVALYRVDSEDRRDAAWHHPPVQTQVARCYRMSNGMVCHSLSIAPLEATCPCGMEDEPGAYDPAQPVPGRNDGERETR